MEPNNSLLCLQYNTPVNSPQNDICLFHNCVMLAHIQFVMDYNHQVLVSSIPAEPVISQRQQQTCEEKEGSTVMENPLG